MTGESAEKSVSLGRFVEWHQEELAEYRASKARLDDIRERAGGTLPENHPNIQFALGELAGRKAVLESAAGFILAISAEESGELEALLEEAPDLGDND